MSQLHVRDVLPLCPLRYDPRQAFSQRGPVWRQLPVRMRSILLVGRVHQPMELARPAFAHPFFLQLFVAHHHPHRHQKEIWDPRERVWRLLRRVLVCTMRTGAREKGTHVSEPVVEAGSYNNRERHHGSKCTEWHLQSRCAMILSMRYIRCARRYID